MGTWIRTVAPDEAEGRLKEEYGVAERRAGRVFHIVRAMSLNPRTLKASMELYNTVMFGPSDLSRRRRELLAVVVSRANDCHYWLHAHLGDLRAEVEGLEGAALERFLEALARDWREAELDDADRTLCAFADKLTAEPAALAEADVEALRAAGFTDAAVHDAIQVVSYFNYINRVADAVHVDLEEGMPPYPR